jgi:hypothetical protein
MKLSRSFAALAVAAFLVPHLVLPSVALAADPAAPSAADRATARALAAEAHRALDAKDYATAAERFARADSLVHAPTLMLGLARADVALGRLVAANEAYNQILRETIPANAPKVFSEAIEDARREVASITPRLCWITVTVAVVGHQGSYKVLLDGVEIPAAAVGVPRAVDPGQHLAIATAVDGVGRIEGSVSVTEGKSATVPLQLKVEPPPPGTVPVVRPLGPTGPGLPPPEPLPPPVSTTRKTIGFAAIGVGAAGIVVGAITGGLALGLHSTLANAPSCKTVCGRAEQGDLDSYNRDGLISTVGFVAGGVLAVAGVVLVVTAPKNPVRVGFQVAPNPGGGTFSFGGAY